jgi:hypothetical protein
LRARSSVSRPSAIPKAIGASGGFTKAKSLDVGTFAFEQFGAGSRGVVFADRGPSQVGHVFNVIVDQRGAVKFWDGQSMSVPKIESQGYCGFWWVKSGN